MTKARNVQGEGVGEIPKEGTFAREWNARKKLSGWMCIRTDTTLYHSQKAEKGTIWNRTNLLNTVNWNEQCKKSLLFAVFWKDDDGSNKKTYNP